MPLTETGVDWLGNVDPLPSRPFPAFPQHLTVSLESTAHEWLYPEETEVAVLMLLTETGVDWSVVLPLPSCPLPASPQHLTVPPESKAQVCV